MLIRVDIINYLCCQQKGDEIALCRLIGLLLQVRAVVQLENVSVISVSLITMCVM